MQLTTFFPSSSLFLNVHNQEPVLLGLSLTTRLKIHSSFTFTFINRNFTKHRKKEKQLPLYHLFNDRGVTENQTPAYTHTHLHAHTHTHTRHVHRARHQTTTVDSDLVQSSLASITPSSPSLHSLTHSLAFFYHSTYYGRLYNIIVWFWLLYVTARWACVIWDFVFVELGCLRGSCGLRSVVLLGGKC